MPIYEYRRPDGTTFEVQQSFSDDALKVDPDTGVPVERVLHPPAVHFKGKGFYNTDYGTRARQRETAAAADKGAEKSAEKSSNGDTKSSKGSSSSTDAGAKSNGSSDSAGSGKQAKSSTSSTGSSSSG
jgi:putative FmdB family regulatory protein